MFIDNIRHQDIQTINLLDTNTNTKKKENENFINHLKIALRELSNIQNHAKAGAEQFVLNQPGVSLNDVMINLEKSSLSLQMAIQIRNKIVSAYQEIMNQQM